MQGSGDGSRAFGMASPGVGQKRPLLATHRWTALIKRHTGGLCWPNNMVVVVGSESACVFLLPCMLRLV